MASRETNPNGVLIQFTADTIEMLNEMADKESAWSGEKVNRSATLRRIIRAEYARRNKSKKVSRGA